MNAGSGQGSGSTIALVVPCYDEADRIDCAAYTDFLDSQPLVSLVFVDDGSEDATPAILDSLSRRHPGRAVVVPLSVNQGKGAAVRVGVLHSLVQEPDYVGYWDADLSTPLDAVLEFARQLDDDPDLWMVSGCRVRRLGADVERSYTRHILGRVFATLASVVLRLGVYDTQCGAKLLRARPELAGLFEPPFLTDWVFDVELFARLAIAARDEKSVPIEGRIYEFPLSQWLFEEGSKLRPRHMFGAIGDLLRIYQRYGRRLRAE